MVRGCILQLPGDHGAQPVRGRELTSHATGAPGACLVSCLAPPPADLAVEKEG